MRQLRQTWKGLLLTLLATSGILIACQKDAKEPEVTSAASATTFVYSPLDPPLSCCVADYSDIVPTTYQCSDLSIKLTNDATNIIIEVERNGTDPNDGFSQVAYGFVDGPVSNRIISDLDKDNDGRRTYVRIELPLTTGYLCGDLYRVAIRVVGLGGMSFEGCGNEWVDASQGGVLLKTFDYNVKSKCVTEGCSMSQGYFFAKPRTPWPTTNTTINVNGSPVTVVSPAGVTVGGRTYSQADLSAIFKMSCNTGSKLGLQQVATIYLSIAKEGGLTAVPAEIQDYVNTIETHLSSLTKKLGTSNTTTTISACDKSLASKSLQNIQTAAGEIGKWIDMPGHHCSE
jgi:hypothetical protein